MAYLTPAAILFLSLVTLSCGITIGAILFRNQCGCGTRTQCGSYIRAQLSIIIQNQGSIMFDVNDLKSIVSTLVSDTSIALKDIADKLTALAANQADPAVTAGINDAVAALTDLDAKIKAADPGPATPPATV